VGFDPTSIPPELNYSKVVMSKSYVIQWKSTVNGRAGRGTKLFAWEAAQQLADELNQGYPSISHEAVEAGGASAQLGQPAQPPEMEKGPEPVEEAEPVEQPEAGSETPQITHDPDPALSFQ